MLTILPCAGYGLRMSMKPNESKEMLVDPYNDNKPLIQWSLDLVQNPLVISREDKESLNKYCEDNKIELFTIQQTQEWPATILESKSFWNDKNLLILPDTRFQPTNVIQEIEKALDTHDLVFATHEVPDVRLWGKVLLDPFSGKPLATQEKPDIQFELNGLAWGLIGFKKEIGEKLFQAYLSREVLSLSKIKTCAIKLDSFKDITRTGKIEEYD